MAINRYTEELFGAIDEIVKKRLEAMEKDNTILCTIEDTTNASQGVYTVSNNALRFIAQSDNTDYAIGQNVWVLVPNGDYENTKLIIGRYISPDSEAFSYVDPFNTFIDMTGNICSGISGITLSLVANEKTFNEKSLEEKYYEKNNSTDDIIDTTIGKDVFQGLDRIGVSAEFNTSFKSANRPFSGNYGLHFIITTDKNNFLDFNLDITDMIGNPYATGWSLQKKVLDFDPEEQGNIANISCYFYQRNNFYANDVNDAEILYPVYTDEQTGEPIANLFVRNLKIQVGYSTNKVSDTTAFLWTNDTLVYNTASNNSIDYTKTMYPRLAYKTGNGYIFINDIDGFDSLVNGNEYPKIKFYYQDYYTKSEDNSIYIDNRAGAYWHEIEDWSGEDRENFRLTRQLFNKTQSFKVIFCFKNESAYTFNSRITELENTLKRTYNDNTFAFTDDERAAIQLFMMPTYTTSEVYDPYVVDGNPGFLDQLATRGPGGGHTSWYNNEWDTTLPQKPVVLLAYISWIAEQYAQTHELVDFLISDENGLKLKYKTSDYADDRKNFEQIKSKLENLYISNILSFTNAADIEGELADLISGLQLVATDNKNGIYNIYKATENSSSELIKASDATTRRNIEASFNSFSTENIELDEAEKIYWLIPKSNTMIKEPADGINFGSAHYNLIRYSETEFADWKSNVNRGHLYTLKASSATYEEVNANIDDYNGTGRYYSKSLEKLILKDRTAELPTSLKNKEEEDYEDYIIYLNERQDIFNALEKTYLDANIDSYWIILEDKTDSTDRLKKASLTYQIKQFYKRSLTNNTIRAAVYRANQLYTASIQLIFGTKTIGDIEYSLSIVPTAEYYNGELVEEGVLSNAWTFIDTDNKTTEMDFKITIFDVNDVDVTSDFNIQAPTWYNNLTCFNPVGTVNNDSFKVGIGDENILTNSYIGGILECTAVKSDNNEIFLTQYYILPVRTNKTIISMDGPDTIVYNQNGVNPSYYNIAYTLKDIGENTIALNTENSVSIIGNGGGEETYYPTVSNNLLIPTLGYLDNALYNFYVKINSAEYGSWYQPILVIKGKDGNATIKAIKENVNVKEDTDKKTISSIMSIGTTNNLGQLTGIVIGNLPDNRSGILGYLDDNETYGFFSDGTAKIPWGALNGVPETMPPSEHTHTKSHITDFAHEHSADDITSGTLDIDRIPSLNANKINDGVFDTDRIPSLNADKITAGTLNVNRIPNLTVSKITDFTTGVQNAINGSSNAVSITHVTINGVRYTVSVVNTGTLLNPIYSLELTR